MRLLTSLVAAVTLTMLGGCGTIMTFAGFADTRETNIQPGVYSGFRWDLWELKNAEFEEAGMGVFRCLLTWDLPLSFAADTVMLPVTAIIKVFRGREAPSRKEAQTAPE